jgi:hypothetical protein
MKTSLLIANVLSTTKFTKKFTRLRLPLVEFPASQLKQRLHYEGLKSVFHRQSVF